MTTVHIYEVSITRSIKLKVGLTEATEWKCVSYLPVWKEFSQAGQYFQGRDLEALNRAIYCKTKTKVPHHLSGIMSSCRMFSSERMTSISSSEFYWREVVELYNKVLKPPHFHVVKKNLNWTIGKHFFSATFRFLNELNFKFDFIFEITNLLNDNHWNKW